MADRYARDANKHKAAAHYKRAYGLLRFGGSMLDLEENSSASIPKGKTKRKQKRKPKGKR